MFCWLSHVSRVARCFLDLVTTMGLAFICRRQWWGFWDALQESGEISKNYHIPGWYRLCPLDNGEMTYDSVKLTVYSTRVQKLSCSAFGTHQVLFSLRLIVSNRMSKVTYLHSHPRFTSKWKLWGEVIRKSTCSLAHFSSGWQYIDSTFKYLVSPTMWSEHSLILCLYRKSNHIKSHLESTSLSHFNNTLWLIHSFNFKPSTKYRHIKPPLHH